MDDAQVLRLARGAARDYTNGRPDAIDEMLRVLLEDPECKHENTHMAGFTQVCDDCGQGRELG